MSNNEDDKFKELDKYVSENYPEAYVYYAMAKLFNWPPHIVDEIDVDLCRIFLLIEDKVNSKDDEEEKEPRKKTPSFPEEWKNMKVEDIVETEEFKKKLDENEKIFNVMKRKHSVK